MPRQARCLVDKQIYHIVNRGNRRETIFHDSQDFDKFLTLLKDAKEKYDIKIYGYCIMPNHFHLVIYARYAESLSKAMHWISSSYVRYYNRRYLVSGHLWQGRYKSFIVEEDSYLLTLLKYVEANPKRAKIVKDCIKYKYSSAYNRVKNKDDDLLDILPIELPDDWYNFINEKDKKIDLDNIRNSIERQAPLGKKEWQNKMAGRYGLESTLNPRGRPWKKEE